MQQKSIKPNKSVGTSEKVHGFSDKRLEEIGEDKKTVLIDFCKFIKGSLIIGHNVTYDISILGSELSRNKLEDIDIKYYDTLDIYRRFHSRPRNTPVQPFYAYEGNKNILKVISTRKNLPIFGRSFFILF